jgi:hypothetical protein
MYGNRTIKLNKKDPTQMMININGNEAYENVSKFSNFDVFGTSESEITIVGYEIYQIEFEKDQIKKLPVN